MITEGVRVDTESGWGEALPFATLGALFDDAPNGIVLLDDRGSILSANPAMADLLGASTSTLQGHNLATLSAGECDTSLGDHLREVRGGLTGRAQAFWTARHPAGHRVHLALSSTTIGGSDGSELILTTAVDVSDRLRHQQQLTYMADHDALTGLMNRSRFFTELQQHLSLDNRAHGALLLLDLDRFKEVNDSLGHGTGDHLIISIASLLGAGLGRHDIVSRLGGDEFAILLRDADAVHAEMVAKEVLERVRAHARALDGAHRRITASIGVVLVTDRHASASDLLAEADMTMYDAKEAGRDRYAILDFTRHTQPRTRARIEWTDRLERAIADDELVLYLQPILDLATGRVIGAEALLRLVDGDTLVTPNQFLDVAEQSDLIVQVDQWVIARSLELLGEIQRTWPDFRLEVNLSGRSMGSPDVEETLRTGIDRHGVDPTGLVLEITETAAVADIQAARAFAQRQRAIGCRFALDDFGAGFGSFYYLKHLLFDYVKIDGEFVAQCHTNPTDSTILRAIVGITHSLGKQAIAEHVSEPEILEAVRAEGVDFAQGYHVGRPVPVEEFMSQRVS